MGGLITLGLLGVLIMMGLSSTAQARGQPGVDPYKAGLSSKDPGEVLYYADELYHSGRTEEAKALREHAILLIGGDTSWESYFAAMPIGLQVQVIDALDTREPGVIRVVAQTVAQSGFADIAAKMQSVADILESAARTVQTQGYPAQDPLAVWGNHPHWQRSF